MAKVATAVLGPSGWGMPAERRVLSKMLELKTKEEAIAALKSHYKGRPFLPDTFTDGNHVKEVKGVYVPFWLFDGSASGSASFEATRSRTYLSGNYRVTETDHFDVYRSGSISFLGIPVDASTKMPDDYMDSIEPFDYRALVPFSPAYLPGYLADKPDVDVEACGERADARAEVTVALCDAAGVDALDQVGGCPLPVRHERADRQDGGRPAG